MSKVLLLLEGLKKIKDMMISVPVKNKDNMQLITQENLKL